MLTLLVTAQNFAAFPDRPPHGRQASRDEHTSNRNSDYICIGRESLALHSSRLSNTSGSGNIDMRAEWDTRGKNPVIEEFRNLIGVFKGSRNQFWDSDEDDELIDYVGDGYNWAEIAARLGRSADSVKGHWYYGNLNSRARVRGVSYKPVHKSRASLRSGPRS